MIKYILFDVDGTLLDFTAGERMAFINTIKHISSIEVNDEDIKMFSKINEEAFQLYNNKKLTRPEFHHLRFEKILKYLEIDSDIDLANQYYVNELKYSAVLYNDVIDCLNYLSQKYELYIASNGMTEVQRKRLELAHINQYFKKEYISEEIGYNKPDKEFFDYIFKDINDLDKTHYAIIGDRMDSDIIGGINAGIHTIYLNRTNSPLNNLDMIYSLNDVKMIL